MSKLKRAPLIFVLVQVRFNADLKMPEHISNIQETLAERGFVRFSTDYVQQVQVGPELKTEAKTRWIFMSRDKREAIVLTNDFVVYETSRYQTFEHFLERFRLMLDALRRHTRVSFATQVGLRYVDLIRPRDSVAAKEFVSLELRGLGLEKLQGEQARYEATMRVDNEVGTLHLRTSERAGQDFLPPDLQSIHIESDVQVTEQEIYRILDFDQICKRDVDLDTKAIVDLLHQMHDQTSRAFKAAVTEDAIKYWSGEDT